MVPTACDARCARSDPPEVAIAAGAVYSAAMSNRKPLPGRAHGSKSAPREHVAMYDNVEDQMRAHVYRLSNGKYGASLEDLDSGEFVTHVTGPEGVVTARARRWVGMSRGQNLMAFTHVPATVEQYRHVVADALAEEHGLTEVQIKKILGRRSTLNWVDASFRATKWPTIMASELVVLERERRGGSLKGHAAGTRAPVPAAMQAQWELRGIDLQRAVNKARKITAARKRPLTMQDHRHAHDVFLQAGREFAAAGDREAARLFFLAAEDERNGIDTRDRALPLLPAARHGMAAGKAKADRKFAVRSIHPGRGPGDYVVEANLVAGGFATIRVAASRGGASEWSPSGYEVVSTTSPLGAKQERLVEQAVKRHAESKPSPKKTSKPSSKKASKPGLSSGAAKKKGG